MVLHTRENNIFYQLTLLHSERPKLQVLAILSAIGLSSNYNQKFLAYGQRQYFYDCFRLRREKNHLTAEFHKINLQIWSNFERGNIPTFIAE